MKKQFAYIALLLAFLLLSVACGENFTSPIADEPAEEITQSPERTEPETEQSLSDDVVEDDRLHYGDVIIDESLAIELFESATAKLILLWTEDPRDVVRMALNDIDIIYEEIHLNGNIVNRTTASFQDLTNYYAQTFTGDALHQILTTTLFVDIEGTLYISMIGGMSGWGISNLSVEKISSNGDNHIFEARFIANGQNTISQFSIANTEAGYRISSIDYILPYLPR